MKLEFETTKKDHEEAAWTHRRKNPDSENDPYQLLNYVGFAATALGVLLLTIRPDGGGRVAPIALIATGLFIPLRQKAVMYSRNKNAWARSERLLQPTVWEFGDSVQVSSPLYDVTYRWGLFTRWIEGPTVFLLYETVDHYRVIPKRAFTSESDMAEFRRILEERVIPPSRGFPITPRS